MKRSTALKATLIAAVLALLTTVGMNFVDRGSDINYPHIDATQELTQPQATIQMDRDFAWRTGDPIQFTVFVAEPSGTRLDDLSFAVSDTNAGDIEFTSQVLGSKREAGGVRLVAVSVTLRKWSYEPSFTLASTMSYIVDKTGETSRLDLPAVTLYMSPTWDGRKQLNPGDQHVVRDANPVLNFVLVGSGLLVALLAFVYIRRARRQNTLARARIPRQLTALERAREDFSLTRDLIDGRDFRMVRYEELERIVRHLFAVESLPTVKVQAALARSNAWALDDVTVILKHCDRRLYWDDDLSESEHAAIFAAFERLLDELPNHEPPPVVKTTRLTPVASFFKRLPHSKLLFIGRAGKWCWRHRPFRYYR